MSANNKPKGGRPVGSKNKPKVNAPAQFKQAPSQTQKKGGKSVGEDIKKLARFDWLLRQFLNSANALQDEFGGIPDQIKIVSDRFDRFHGMSIPSNISLFIDRN
jgi:hypothetical protein